MDDEDIMTDLIQTTEIVFVAKLFAQIDFKLTLICK